jgi:diguanylate cyclase (GGDEF)-like protein
MNISGFFKRIYNFMTFTDIPIWQKLLLFAAGGIGWYIVIAMIGLLAINHVNYSSQELTDKIMPQVQTGQKVIIMIRGANVSVHNIVIYDDVKIVNSNIKRAAELLDRATAALTSLMEGGKILDYSDLTGELIEEIKVPPVKGDSVSEKYISRVLGYSQKLRDILDDLASVKLAGLEKGKLTPEDKALLMQRLEEYNITAIKSVTILSRFTSYISTLQKNYINNIKTVLYQSMVLVIFIGLLAILLLIVFSSFLRTSITRPLKAITEQIKGLSEGEVDLTKQITVGSKDEIGELSANFNVLMHTIHDMNTFKKVVEEDDTLEDVYNRLAKVFQEKLGLKDILIYEVPDRKNTMHLINTPFSKEEVCCNKEILINNTLCRARKTGRVISSIEYPEICRQFLLTPEKYHICIPMIIGGTTGGVIQFQFDKPTSENAQNEVVFIDVSQIEKKVLKAHQYIKESSAVIEAKRLTGALKESAVRDQLTGLYNRRFLEEYIETLVAGTMRKGSMLGMLMCDLDFFKEVNDKYGHDAGDMVLKETASIISRNARSADLVIRFGGEEFLVILNDAKEGEAEEIAERIRAKVENAKIKTGGGFVQRTISIGFSEFPKDTPNFWEAIKYADIALYKAKEAGRNRIMRFTREMWTEKAY